MEILTMIFFDNVDDGLEMMRVLSWQHRALAMKYLRENDYSCKIKDLLQEYQKIFLWERIDLMEMLLNLKEEEYILSSFSSSGSVVKTTELQCKRFFDDFEKLVLKPIKRLIKEIYGNLAGKSNKDHFTSYLKTMLKNLPQERKEAVMQYIYSCSQEKNKEK